jgi:ABC-type lipoprotein release transport system permease subunit
MRADNGTCRSPAGRDPHGRGGLAAAAGAGRAIQTLLFNVQPLEPVVSGGVAVVFALVAALACLLPSWRASRIDPLVALCAE